ncbi:uncharacterized protein LOC131960960 [Centropristis striata]|uniref:uncharacterized protein LOC131960960 n=1 Tax=Centropristis striata TaxID=184440 RepID=UPI0027E1ABD5|nr:uncharacterized protein LOC131960960 [Centropristis striata]
MASKPKKHRSMGDDEWMSRLRRFAASGVWPSEAGNRPAPRQKKWHDLYQKIEKCPMQQRGQASLFGGTRACNCGFHTNKPSSSVPVSSLGTPQPGSSSACSSSAAVKPGQMPQKRILTLSSFTKPRFGGSHGAMLKPNLSLARKHSPKTADVSSPIISPTKSRVSPPDRSPKTFLQIVSPLSLPPSPVPVSSPASSILPSTATAEVLSATSSCVSSGTPSAPLTSPLPKNVGIPPV